MSIKSKAIIISGYSRLTLEFIKLAFENEENAGFEIVDTHQKLCGIFKTDDLFRVWIEHGQLAAHLIDEACSGLAFELMDQRQDLPQIIFVHRPLLESHVWPAFLNNVRPYWVHINLSVIEAYDHLKGIRKLHRQIGNPKHKHFGLWDNNVVTHQVDQRYKLMTRQQARPYITSDMALYQRSISDSPIVPNFQVNNRMIKKDQAHLQALIMHVLRHIPEFSTPKVY